jgi:hypothetical protein
MRFLRAFLRSIRLTLLLKTQEGCEISLMCFQRTREAERLLKRTAITQRKNAMQKSIAKTQCKNAVQKRNANICRVNKPCESTNGLCASHTKARGLLKNIELG